MFFVYFGEQVLEVVSELFVFSHRPIVFDFQALELEFESIIFALGLVQLIHQALIRLFDLFKPTKFAVFTLSDSFLKLGERFGSLLFNKVMEFDFKVKVVQRVFVFDGRKLLDLQPHHFQLLVIQMPQAGQVLFQAFNRRIERAAGRVLLTVVARIASLS